MIGGVSMYEHRYREISAHGLPDFPFDVYTNEHHENNHAILPIHWHNEMEMIYLVKGSAHLKSKIGTILYERAKP